MELRHLRYFVAVADELHFRRAAERLHVAQPAISEQVRKLEAELGVRLFDRTQRSVALTDAGAAMLDEARGVLRQVETARRLALQASERSTRRLRIGYLPDALPAAFPRLLRHVAQGAPDLDLDLGAGHAQSLIDDVREQRIDAAVVCLPAPVRGLRVTHVGEERAVAAMLDSHPAARAPEVELASLERTRLVLLPRTVDPAFYDALVAACSQAGIIPALNETAGPTVEQALLEVTAGGGIAVLPQSAAARYTAPGVRFLPLAPPAPSCDVAIVTDPTTKSSAVETFLRFAEAAAAAPRRPQPLPTRPTLVAVA
jgi:DNA-binding transcriptional LysR family regulator